MDIFFLRITWTVLDAKESIHEHIDSISNSSPNNHSAGLASSIDIDLSNVLLIPISDFDFDTSLLSL